jgi:hypothetical protein
MWTERQIFAITKKHSDEVTITNNTVKCRPSRLMHWWNRFINSSYYDDMIDDTAVLYSEILSLRLCKSAGRVWDSLIFKLPHKKESEAERSGERDGQEMSL